MKPEYDFSKAERGKFYRPNASMKSPIYLEDRVQEFVKKKAEERGIDPDEVVNEILLKEMALLRSSQ